MEGLTYHLALLIGSVLIVVVIFFFVFLVTLLLIPAKFKNESPELYEKMFDGMNPKNIYWKWIESSDLENFEPAALRDLVNINRVCGKVAMYGLIISLVGGGGVILYLNHLKDMA